MIRSIVIVFLIAIIWLLFYQFGKAELGYLKANEDVSSPCAVPITEGDTVKLLKVQEVNGQTYVTIECPGQIVSFEYPYDKMRISR